MWYLSFYFLAFFTYCAVPFILVQMTWFHCFLWQNSIPLHIQTTFSLSFHWGQTSGLITCPDCSELVQPVSLMQWLHAFWIWTQQRDYWITWQFHFPFSRNLCTVLCCGFANLYSHGKYIRFLFLHIRASTCYFKKQKLFIWESKAISCSVDFSHQIPTVTEAGAQPHWHQGPGTQS